MRRGILGGIRDGRSSISRPAAKMQNALGHSLACAGPTRARRLARGSLHDVRADRGELAALGPGLRPELLVCRPRRDPSGADQHPLGLLNDLPGVECGLQLRGELGRLSAESTATTPTAYWLYGIGLASTARTCLAMAASPNSGHRWSPARSSTPTSCLVSNASIHGPSWCLI